MGDPAEGLLRSGRPRGEDGGVGGRVKWVVVDLGKVVRNAASEAGSLQK